MITQSQMMTLVRTLQEMSRRGQERRFGGQLPTTAKILQQGGDSGRGDVGAKGTAESGPLDASEKAALGMASRGLGLANTVAGLLGAGLPGLGTAKTAMNLGIRSASALADYFGVQREYDPMLGLDPTSIRDISDFQGAFAAAEAERAALDARQSMFDAMQAGQNVSPGSPAGWGGDPSAPSASVGPEAGWGAFGPDSGNTPGTASMGSGSAEGGLAGVGEAPGDSGRNDGTSPGIAKGGAFYVNRPTKVRFGEPQTGGEAAIFVPRTMGRPGLQPNELEVLRGLRKAMLFLQGGG